MSRLQELHPDQQAVLQLVLRRRMPYADLAGLLDLTPEGVRERALDAIDGLAPEDVEGLALEDRDRIADHLLGQDAGADREATAALIAEHVPATTWATTVAVELEPLGGPAAELGAAVAGTPGAIEPGTPGSAVAGGAAAAIAGDATAAPDTGATGDGAPVAGAAPEAVGADAAPAYQAPATGRPVHGAPTSTPAATADAAPRTPRRGAAGGRRTSLAGRPPKVLAGAGAAALVVLLLVLWIAGAFGGGSGDDGDTQASAPPATTTAAADATPTAAQRAAAAQFVAALPQSISFRPTSSTPAAYRRVTGTAKPAISQANAASPVLALTIRGLPAPTSSRSYFAWADKNGADPIFLGQLTDRSGAELPFQGLDLKTRQAAVVDPTTYSRVRITLETKPQPSRPGPTIIVGTITPRAS
ncbi:hypothetical protein [Patulibacter sp.]|uniref:hypothetical protein n=1 Tax=Patulibacter sp. TaxID=1912859 RepID=UPI00271A6304|nr:hypothetical protein [Patulibacter sp.]MDO9410507.1 hypothetical protein [Patulibacter sp.]